MGPGKELEKDSLHALGHEVHLWDWYAGQALSAMLQHQKNYEECIKWVEEISEDVSTIADKMLERHHERFEAVEIKPKS